MGEGVARRAYDSVSEQKMWSDGRGQPMGCWRGASGVREGRGGGGWCGIVGGRERGRCWYFYAVTSR